MNFREELNKAETRMHELILTALENGRYGDLLRPLEIIEAINTLKDSASRFPDEF